MKDWDSYKNGWYKIKIKVKSDQEFTEIRKWLEETVEGHRKHTMWKIDQHRLLEVRFRHKKDYEWFVLRWS